MKWYFWSNKWLESLNLEYKTNIDCILYWSLLNYRPLVISKPYCAPQLRFGAQYGFWDHLEPIILTMSLKAVNICIIWMGHFLRLYTWLIGGTFFSTFHCMQFCCYLMTISLCISSMLFIMHITCSVHTFYFFIITHWHHFIGWSTPFDDISIDESRGKSLHIISMFTHIYDD